MASASRQPFARLRAEITEAVELTRFSAQVVARSGGAWRHFAEILRQAGILLAGTTLILIGLQVCIGAVCGVAGNYAFRSIGASDFVGFLTSTCVSRGAVPIMFGYVMAAKVGCGLVAEIGSMRISEELDAFESVGLDPLRFVVATRLLAAWIVVPLLFAVSVAAADLGSFLSVTVLVGEVSRGTWEGTHWALQNPADFARAFVQSFLTATIVVIVACFYGWTARGGPDKVGAATAKSMVVNLVVVHFMFGVSALVFYGGDDPKYPIGG
jgi:phospholipid/cholesterol/gamma-HCH transport system permease protein